MARREAVKLEVHPLTPARWADFERLFGAKGACNGCWCMWPRLGSAYAKTKATNKRAMKRIVDARKEPGLLGYAGKDPVAWIALGPRDEYPPLLRSRVMEALDDRPAWVVMCFFIAKDARGTGCATPMLEAAVAYAKRHGAKLLEGFPHDVDSTQPGTFMWQGLASTFLRAGFKEVARRSPRRPYMRRELGSGERSP